LSSENKIRTYENFRRFCEEFFRLLPSFETLEDFVPETDWGEIEYFFQDQRYRIFYGSELCNAYDFYYGFEIVFAELDIEWGDGFSIPPKRSPGVQFCTAFGTTPAEYSESCFIFRCPVRWPFCSRNNPWTMQSTAT